MFEKKSSAGSGDHCQYLESKYAPKGSSRILALPLAIAGSVKQAREPIESVNVEIWRCLAEICQESVKKGKLVDDETHLKKNKYEDKGEARSFTKVVTQFTHFLVDRRAGFTPFEKANLRVF